MQFSGLEVFVLKSYAWGAIVGSSFIFLILIAKVIDDAHQKKRNKDPK